jgi:UDP-N-acetylmuramate--alanine ligase
VLKLDEIKYIYFLGIGGIGMSALARYFKAKGKDVSGYDKTRTKLTDELSAEGIDIHFDDNIELVKSEIRNAEGSKNNVLIVVTPAVPKDHSEYVYFKQLRFTIKKRAEVLGAITKQAHTIAVAGTHGKTTTSSLTAHILKSSGMDITAFLGGITQNYNTNLLLASAGKEKEIIVVEADEYDRSFLTLYPQVAVITSMDADHLDIYGSREYVEESYSLFSQQVGETLIIKKSIEQTLKYGERSPLTYTLNGEADFSARNLKIEEGQYVYDIQTPAGMIGNVTLGLPGMHNVENSIAATAAAKQMGVSDDAIRSALASFRGVKRRFDYQVKTKELVYIDDYAHHPEELRACISSVRQLYPGKKITGIFQPHLYSRTRDFANEFAESLGLLDELILMEIYPARELPIEGVTSSMLLDKVKLGSKKIVQKAGLVDEIKTRDLQVLLTMGAGDIDTFVEPIKAELEKRITK